MKLHNKIIVVTGAGSGMGRELTIQLVQRGARVAMADINEQNMQETAQLAGPDKVSVHVLNVADKAAVDAFPEAVIKAHGTVDGIINNAGIIQPFVHVKDLDFERIERIMHINFYGTLYMVKAFLPHLLKRPEAHIANVSSMGGFIPFPGQTLYGASKAAVKLLTEGLYAELKNTNVRVTIIFPGAVNTNIVANSGVQLLPAAADPEQAARALPASKAATIMLDGIEKNAFRILVGSDARMLDTIYRFNPRYAVNFIVKQMGKMVSSE